MRACVRACVRVRVYVRVRDAREHTRTHVLSVGARAWACVSRLSVFPCVTLRVGAWARGRAGARDPTSL